ncbi:MAG: T9SS type A sorting domain-containing protein [Bacteroidota bacterium]
MFQAKRLCSIARSFSSVGSESVRRRIVFPIRSTFLALFLLAGFGLTHAQIFSNGSFINSPGTGVGGADESILQTASLGMTTFGLGHQVGFGNTVSDDFVVPSGEVWILDEIELFAYQSFSTTASTITDVRVRIWDGVPGAGSNVVFGNLTTNRLISTTWTGAYRVTEESAGANTDRPVMVNTVDLGVVLSAGTYYLEWQADGTLGSGPWAPPITINGQTTTGNGLQSQDNGDTFDPALDTGSGTQQGFPFNLFGQIVPEGIEEVNLAAINNVNVTLSEDCDATLIPAQVLTGDFDVDDNGIVPANDAFNIVVQDSDPSNGPVIDGCGTYQWMATADPDRILGFTTAWGFINAEDKISPELADSLEAPTPLYCDEIDDINVTLLPLNVSRCWIQSGENGNTLNSSMNMMLRERLLLGGGIPNFLDNCSDVEICVNDVVNDNGSCDDVILTRTFTARDGLSCSSVSGEENAPNIYSYDIIFIRPTIDDVVGVAPEARFDCDDDTFPVLPPNQFGQVNPAPQPGDYPFFPGPDGPIFLGENFCNIGSTFLDGPQIQTCDQTFKVVRTFTVIDWCQPDIIRTFTQLVKVGDFDAPVITAPTQDLNFNGVPDQDEGLGPISFSTGNPDCSANFIVPAGNAIDNCDPSPNVTVFIYPFEDTNASPFGPFQVGGGAFEIPEGQHTLRYIAEDDCENADTLDVPFIIEDRTAPVAICEDGLDVTIGGSGNAILTPDDIDRASYDDCSDITRLIAFVGDDNQPLSDFETMQLTGIAQGGWRPSIQLTCEILDGDPDSPDFVAVGLQVEDDEGNTNTCWLDVLVEDKIAPLCVAPAPRSIPCNDPDIETLPQDLNTAFNEDPAGISAQLDVLFGEANGTDNCPIEAIAQSVQDTRNSCGVGSIIRSFSVSDGEGLTSSNTCIQIITVLGIHDYTIVFPADFETEECIHPTFNEVTFEEFGCDLLTTTVTIDTFLASSDECYKLRVTYELLNWCEYGTEAAPYVIPRDADGDDILEERTFLHVLPRNQSTEDDDIAWLDRDNNRFNGFISPLDDDDPNGQVPGASDQPYGTDASRGAFLYRQFIKVYDDTPPVVTTITDDLVFEDLEGSCDEPVVIDISVVDACSTPDDYTATAELDPFFMDIDGDGILTLADFVPTDNTALFPNAVNNNDGTFTVSFNVNLPIGRHAVRFRATDGCANAETILIIFEVTDEKAPTPVCINGLTVTLMPDGEGGGTAAVWANEYVVSDSGDCTDPVKFTIHHPDEFDALDDGSQIPNTEVDTGIVLDCDDRGMLLVRIYAVDGAGQFDYCQTTLMVQQFQDGICPDTGGGNILGNIETPSGTATADVEVSITDQGNMDAMVFTNASGDFSFTDLELHEDYTIAPLLEADVNVVSSITTMDVLMINRHILAIEELASPYQHVVADVNMDGEINVIDAVHIRMVIMGQTPTYPQGPTWRFMDRDYDFSANSADWAGAQFPEVFNANDLEGDITDADFFSLEMGNVSDAVLANNLTTGGSAEARGQKAVIIEDGGMNRGATYSVPVYMANVYGLQGTLELGAGADLAGITYGQLTADNVNLEQAADGMITFSYDNVAGTNDEVLFTLEIQASADGKISDFLSLTDRITPAEAYPTEGGVADLRISFTNEISATADFLVEQNSPNPVTDRTVIRYTLPEAGTATLAIRDIQGRTVLVRESEASAGSNVFVINRGELSGAAGVLSYTITAGDRTATHKMVVVR